MTQDGYLLDNAAAAAGPRMDALAQLFDPSTFRHIDALGIVPGWRCWEVGAGGASVVRWLARRVGPAGRVLATDIDVSWTRAAAADNVTIQRHDVAADPPPDLVFDLVHARLVLIHVADRERALRQMISTLRPGGWLLIEDADPALQPLVCLDPRSPAEVLANRIYAEFRALLAERGADLAYGRQLPRALRNAGLCDVAADAYFPVALPASRALEHTTIEHIRGRLIASGRVSAEEIERHLASVDAGAFDLATPPMISAWGRRPAAG
ncbi:MAG TPA: methyltransferase domain-containing protein [Kofleriaceae bacterium]|nr:methyltransferase domain-containing protein [Kofleriaceae bacterium]